MCRPVSPRGVSAHLQTTRGELVRTMRDAVCALPSALLCIPATPTASQLTQSFPVPPDHSPLASVASDRRRKCASASSSPFFLLARSLSLSSLAHSHERHTMSSPRGGLEQEASQPCPSTRRMPPVSQRLRLEREASQPCSSRQHRLTCWHVLHAASGPSHALARFPATSVLPLPLA